MQIISDKATIFIPLSEIIDIEKEIARLEAEKQKLLSEIERIDKKLANEGFVSKAPAAVIDGERARRWKPPLPITKNNPLFVSFSDGKID